MNQVTILVADDERLERTILCRKLLREFGDSCELLQAENGREAVNLFEEHHPQIAILDVMMPGFTGIEVAAQIRRKDPYCILVFLSAY
ncbi:MAG: response regulator transcription factor, partial [Lachnospiraceae bacterium]